MPDTRSKWMIATFLLAACVFLSVPAVGQGKPTQNVLVVNGVGQPVPIAAQGTTNVAGTVSVGNTPNVNVANTPNVNVANQPTVTVGNTPAAAVPVKDQYDPALQTLWSVFKQQATTNSSLEVEFPTPATQVVVVKHASAFCQGLPAATDMILEVLVTQGNPAVISPSVFIPLETKSTPFGGIAVGGSPLNLTIPAASQVGLFVFTTTSAGNALCELAVNGYSVTVP